jgi:rod shape determining protein RodA
MIKYIWSRLKYLDIPLMILSGLLILIGVVVLYATSLSDGNMSLVYRQVAAVVGGSVLFFFFAFYNYHHLAKINPAIYVLLVVSLLLVLVFAREIRGSSRWIDLGFFQLQPSEFVKIAVIVGLSRWFYLKRGQINSWQNIIITFIFALIPAGLIILQPDLGSALVIFGIWFGILLISPVKKKFIFYLLIAGAVVAFLSWHFVLGDFQKDRVRVFLNPAKELRGRGYNVRQAIIAVGNGQIFGQGLGKGLQNQLKFLPERHTDFIFAATSEEVGFVGAVLIVFLYFFMFMRLLKICREAKDDLGMYMCGGVLFMLLGQMLVNVGMNIGLMPVTGIPLPFLTYGGSSMLTALISLGIAQNVAEQSKVLRF